MKFNNKILILITVLSIALGLLVSKYVAFLNNFRTVSCIVSFFILIMLYNAYLHSKETKMKKETLKNHDENSPTQIDNTPTVVDVTETINENEDVLHENTDSDNSTK